MMQRVCCGHLVEAVLDECTVVNNAMLDHNWHAMKFHMFAVLYTCCRMMTTKLI